LNNLKTLLETGKPLPEFDFLSDAKKLLAEMKKAVKKQLGDFFWFAATRRHARVKAF